MDGRFKVHKVDFLETNCNTIHEGMQMNNRIQVPINVDTDAYSVASTTCLHDPAGKRRRSLAQFTREALPRLENYRNSRRAMKRPSLGELHGGEELFIKDPNVANDQDTKPSLPTHEGGVKLGWIQGVLIPCLLNIWGVMLFLRLSWVVAQSGIGESLLIIGISAVVCVITTLSLSALCTNGEVKGGGIYYIISRSLGPEFGASVGLVFAFANAVSAGMNTIGFCNSLNDLLSEYDLKIIDGGANDVRLVGVIAMLVMVFICCVGMEWESKAQNILIAVICGAIVDFIVGTSIGPITDAQTAKGFTGFKSEVFKTNWNSNYRHHDGIDYDFFAVFAIFFPSVTGIQAGANISGDLKDPASSIPKGTLLALLLSMASYAAFVLIAGGAAIRDASGFVGNITDCGQDCSYGLHNSYSMMQTMSSWGPLIYAGCFAATISTALTNLLSVPRLIQALGIDRIYPKLIFFSKGYGKSGEPYRGYVLTFIVASLFVLIADLNLVAPLISNFYLASYALINFCTFHAALIKPLGWRPTFRFYNTWLSLAGFFMCVAIMFLISWVTSLITFFITFGLYLLVVYRKPDVNWGSSTQAQIYKTALTSVQRLGQTGEHVKNYRPQILVLAGRIHARPPLVDFANLISKNNSLLIIGEISEKRISHRTKASRIKSGHAWLRARKVKGFINIIDGFCFEEGANAFIQASGIGKLAPNLLMMGFKNDWRSCNTDDLIAYFNVLHNAFDNRLAVAILRLPDGLDYSRIMDDEENGGCYSSGDLTLVGSHQTTHNHNGVLNSPVSQMMHADSNLSISHLGVSETIMTSSMPALTFLNHHKINSSNRNLKSKKKIAQEKILFTSATGQHLHRSILDNMSVFQRKQDKGTIDVWWLYDDGGLTMLLPYIISTRNDWTQCKLRIFALANNKNELELEERNMANLLSKFRLDYSSIKMVQISDKPQDSTLQLFDNLIEDFKEKDGMDNECYISDIELATLQEKTNRQLRLRELLIENSNEATLIVMSLPMPRKGTVSAPLYMAWLEILTRDLPPYLLVRGNQQSVLTFYS